MTNKIIPLSNKNNSSAAMRNSASIGSQHRRGAVAESFAQRLARRTVGYLTRTFDLDLDNLREDMRLNANVQFWIWNGKHVQNHADFLHVVDSPRRTRQAMVDYAEGHNKILDAGLEQDGRLWLGLSTNAVTDVEVGSGTTAVDAGDPGLETPLANGKVAVSYRNQSANISTCDGFLAQGEGTGDINEVGLWALTIFLARIVLNNTKVKAAEDTATARWTVTRTSVN